MNKNSKRNLRLKRDFQSKDIERNYIKNSLLAEIFFTVTDGRHWTTIVNTNQLVEEGIEERSTSGSHYVISYYLVTR